MGKNLWKLNIDEVASGPFSEEEIRSKYFGKKIPQDTYVWRKGLKEWIPINESGILSTEVTAAEGMPREPQDFMPPGLGKSEAHDGQASPRWAGFGVRFIAYLLDVLVLMVGMVPMALLFPKISPITGPLLGLYYLVFFQAKTGATIGKRKMGLKIVSKDFSPVTPKQLFLRFLGMILSGMPLYLGYFWVGFDAKKRGWHDMIAGTLVIYDDFNTESLRGNGPGADPEQQIA